jgi:thiamine pyrophosphate-dependent acetolactate synthase large subunit-like protein
MRPTWRIMDRSPNLILMNESMSLAQELQSELEAHAKREELEKETKAKAQEMMEKLNAQDAQKRLEMRIRENIIIAEEGFVSDVAYAARVTPYNDPAPTLTAAAFAAFGQPRGAYLL